MRFTFVKLMVGYLGLALVVATASVDLAKRMCSGPMMAALAVSASPGSSLSLVERRRQEAESALKPHGREDEVRIVALQESATSATELAAALDDSEQSERRNSPPQRSIARTTQLLPVEIKPPPNFPRRAKSTNSRVRSGAPGYQLADTGSAADAFNRRFSLSFLDTHNDR